MGWRVPGDCQEDKPLDGARDVLCAAVAHGLWDQSDPLGRWDTAVAGKKRSGENSQGGEGDLPVYSVFAGLAARCGSSATFPASSNCVQTLRAAGKRVSYRLLASVL